MNSDRKVEVLNVCAVGVLLYAADAWTLKSSAVTENRGPLHIAYFVTQEERPKLGQL